MKKRNKLIFIVILSIGFSSFAQKSKSPNKSKYNYIITTDNMDDIQEFLNTANHEDPRFPICKRRLVELKNKTWMHNGPVAYMQPRPIQKVTQVQFQSAVNPVEFDALVKQNDEKHTERTVHLLNSLFNPDLKNEEKIVLVQNGSSCNIIVSMQGVKPVKIAIPAKSEDFVIVKKGSYNLEANVCGVSYKSIKNFQQNQIITLGQPVLIGQR